MIIIRAALPLFEAIHSIQSYAESFTSSSYGCAMCCVEQSTVSLIIINLISSILNFGLRSRNRLTKYITVAHTPTFIMSAFVRILNHTMIQHPAVIYESMRYSNVNTERKELLPHSGSSTHVDTLIVVPTREFFFARIFCR